MSSGNEPSSPMSWGSRDDCYYGLTKREYIATQTMVGLLVNNAYLMSPQEVAREAIALADALLGELE